jgi:hypothetical protein
MNAINDNNDPFEDIFRDRFADFESEPNEILWNKIEPQLPVNPTRRFPYWQISAVILGLFLGGIYFTQDMDDESIPYLSQLDNVRLPLKEKLPYLSESKTDKGEIPYLSESRADNGNLPLKGRLPYLPESVSKKEEHKQVTKKTDVADNQENKNYNQSINAQKTIEGQPSFVTSNNISENPLNPSNSQQSNPKITDNSIFEPNNKNLNGFTNPSNIFESKSVSFSNNKNAVERKVNLSILNTKSYGLLANHFKTAKLKFVTIPKEEPYFKEKKPLEFYASAMPLLNYYTITPNGNDANFVHNISVNDDGDRVGFYTQAGLVFTLSDRFKLRTGLTFTKTNHSISYRVRTDSLVVQPADNKGVDISFADLNKTYSQSANYLGTKIEVQYAFLQGEALTHYVSVGGEASYRLNGNHELNGFANFAYGITRQIGDKAYIFIEPTFSYSLNQQSDNNSLLLVKPNKIGFNIGVNFKIK